MKSRNNTKKHKGTAGLRMYYSWPENEATVGLLVPSMILVQSSCHSSVFLMCSNVLAAASFTGNTYCWRKQWGGEEEGGRRGGGINVTTEEIDGPVFSY